MRRLLRLTGTPQAASARQIGPLPNLRPALNGIANIYAEPAVDCVWRVGTLASPFCDLPTAIQATPVGGTLGIVGGSAYGSWQFSKRMTIIAVGGTVRIGAAP